MPSRPSVAAWQRLGRLLKNRRLQIDPDYSNLTRFCRDRNIDYRLAWDIEKGARTNYREVTLAGVEAAYQLDPGSIASALGGGELRPAGFLTAEERAMLDGLPDKIQAILERGAARDSREKAV